VVAKCIRQSDEIDKRGCKRMESDGWAKYIRQSVYMRRNV